MMLRQVPPIRQWGGRGSLARSLSSLGLRNNNNNGLLTPALMLTRQPRRTVGLASNDTDLNETDASKTEASTINTISKGLGGFLFSSTTTQAQLQVVANGLGSVVHIFCPPKSFVRVRPGSLIARSSTLKTTTSMFNNPVKATWRKMGGGSFSMTTISASSKEGDCLVSPEPIGDIAILNMDGSQDYVIANKSFLAATANISLGMSFLSDISPSIGKMYVPLTGTGSVAVSASGGLFRLVLEEGETYIASTKHLIAWNGSMSPKLNVKDDGILSKLGFLAAPFALVQSWFRNDMVTCELHGPGDFYLTSRLEQTRKYKFSMFHKQPVDAAPQIVTVTDTPHAYTPPVSPIEKVEFLPDDDERKTLSSGVSTKATPTGKDNAKAGNNNSNDDSNDRSPANVVEGEIYDKEEGKPETTKKPWYKFW